ncbi:MAG TPA: DUF72 domain-containing protein [Thermotoga sp.]|nr:DUF72 domain-containing protein [Thermotoga sp.]
MLYIGTSGFSFNDWIGRVYPENIKPSQMLKYYWAVWKFNAVELNFTYYTLPTVKSIISMLRKTPMNFYFVVKLPGRITHEAWKNGEMENCVNKFLKTIQPMIDEGRLKLLLAQFPYSFKFSRKNVEYIEKIREYFKGLDIAIEYRHRSWLREEVFEYMKKRNIVYVIVDEPPIKELFPYYPYHTTSKAYYRFHGRNKKWFEAENGERYDYLYSTEELKKFAKDVRRSMEEVKEVFVFFNNCHRGSAVINALDFSKMLKG